LNNTEKPTFEKPDLSYLMLLMDNDTEIVLEVLEIFKLQTPIDVQNLELHTKNNDWQMLSKSAHKLKSSVGNLGMNQLKDWFLFIEINGKQETNLDRLNELVNLSIQGTKQLVKDIEEEILKLKGKGI
jgi:HPt (histidine-containing phosphotransfer) domain-containing protein